MKNIHVLPTDKPSRLCINGKNGQHIYITSDEEIKYGDWYFINGFKNVKKTKLELEILVIKDVAKKIILTTDQDLIKDGVHPIDDEFLEWFVKNPSCKFVEVKNGIKRLNSDGEEIGFPDMSSYKIIIPKEETKQETLEEAAEKMLWTEAFTQLFPKWNSKNVLEQREQAEIKAFIKGANWQQKRMYSEEDMEIAWDEAQKLKTECMANGKDKKCYFTNEIHCQHKRLVKFSEWFEQFKKK